MHSIQNFKTPTAEVWSLIKLFKKKSFSCEPSISSGISPSTLYQEIILKLCPPSYVHVHCSTLESFEEEDAVSIKTYKELESPFTFLKYKTALNSMKFKSAPDLDQVDYDIISSFPDNFATLLLQIFNNILLEGVFPPQWTQSIDCFNSQTAWKWCSSDFSIVMLSKINGKDDILYIRLQWFIESRHILPDTQFRIQAR